MAEWGVSRKPPSYRRPFCCAFQIFATLQIGFVALTRLIPSCRFGELPSQSLQDRGGHQMLKLGLYLLSTSTVGVLYRVGDFAYSMNPFLKMYCEFGLSVSLLCFAG